MLDPMFSLTDLFLRDPGPRRIGTAGPAWRWRRENGPRYPERVDDIRR